MKSFAWLALFSFCTALAQVQPVVMPLAQVEPCCCCEDKSADTCAQATAKGMDDCVPCAPCFPSPSTLLPATSILVPNQCAEISRLSWLAENGRTLVYPPLLTPPRFLG